MSRVWFAFAGLLAVACTPSEVPESTQSSALEEIRSGYEFLTPDTQALQDDPFENPGYLWVDRGAALFQANEAGTKACASCHEDGLSGAATYYPALDAQTGKLLNLEGRINKCRTEHQDLPTLAYESEDLLALTAYVANQSKGLASNVEPSDALSPYLETGERYFRTRRGQFNLSCAQCHDQTWGNRLRGDTISQGHGNGFPAYRLEWQGLGSLHRRLRDCDTGVRAEPLPYGAETYIAVELYLTLRAGDLLIESPAVRR